MALRTRREVLLGAAGLLVGPAGCNEEAAGRSPTVPAAPTDPGRRRSPGETGVHDPERAVLRSGEGPLAWFAEDVATGRTDDATDTGTVPAGERETGGAVTDGSTAATLAFADVAGADEARAFVDATDFDRETLYLHHSPVTACERLRLCSVSWSDGEVSIRYARFLGDWNEPREAGETDTRATLVRLPVALGPTVRPGSTTWRDTRRCAGATARPAPSDRPSEDAPSDRPSEDAARVGRGDRETGGVAR